MRIQCPNCGASGEIDESKRPAGATSIRCPRCSNTIPFDLTGAESESIKQPKPEPVSALQSPIPQTFPGNETIPKPSERTEISGISTPVALQRNVAPVKGVCSLCFETFPREDMLRFDSYLVCASCKPIYEQMLQEGVSMPSTMRYAGFWQRLAAKLIDGVILGGVFYIFYIIMIVIFFSLGVGMAAFSHGRKPVPPDASMDEVFMLIGLAYIILIFAIYMVFNTFFLRKYGATPGKMALGLLVVNPEGDKISNKRAFCHALAELLSLMTVNCLTLGAGYLLMLFDKQKRTLHDLICDTRVVLK